MLGKVLPANSFSDPWLVIIIHASLFLWVSSHVRHGLQVSGLGLEPLVDEQLRILGEAKEELATSLQTVDGLHGLVDLVVQRLYLLLRGSGQQEVVHLSLESVVNL